MNGLYHHGLRLFENLFLPSANLLRKARVGARVRRVYDSPQTSLVRVLTCPEANPAPGALDQHPLISKSTTECFGHYESLEI